VSSWYFPALHAAQDTIESLLYCPATHAVHVLAAADARVSVTEPAEQLIQLICPAAPWYWPASQLEQLELPGALYRPVQVEQPELPEPLCCPPAQLEQLGLPAELYWPLPHMLQLVA
jgi:hypothetical protein